MWYIHDRAAPPFARVTRDYLNGWHPEEWRGRGGPVAWPPGLFDLNPLDFYPQGHLESKAYAALIHAG